MYSEWKRVQICDNDDNDNEIIEEKMQNGIQHVGYNLNTKSLSNYVIRAGLNACWTVIRQFRDNNTFIINVKHFLNGKPSFVCFVCTD